jgi:hypothetical protein
MSPRSLFLVVIKIIGLVFLRDALFTIPQLLSFIATIPYVTPTVSGSTTHIDFSAMALPLLLILFYVTMVFLLLFKTNLVINWLRLDRGFDQPEFSFNMRMDTILTIAVIAISGFILIDEIPMLCKRILSYFQEKKLTLGRSDSTSPLIVVSVVKIVIALLLIGERKRIVAFIHREKDDPVGNDEPECGISAEDKQL